jgi:hypothetical protein
MSATDTMDTIDTMDTMDTIDTTDTKDTKNTMYTIDIYACSRPKPLRIKKLAIRKHFSFLLPVSPNSSFLNRLFNSESLPDDLPTY